MHGDGDGAGAGASAGVAGEESNSPCRLLVPAGFGVPKFGDALSMALLPPAPSAPELWPTSAESVLLALSAPSATD